MKVKAIFASLLFAAVMMFGATAANAADYAPAGWTGAGAPVAAQQVGSRGHADNQKDGATTDGPKDHKTPKHHKHGKHHHKHHHHKDGGK
ncbi:MAG: hypothetical protein ACREJ2_10160 [Planctomycetota bacterium]